MRIEKCILPKAEKSLKEEESRQMNIFDSF